MDLALLAPVPEEHLLAGRETCAKEGKVAFGTRSFEPFANLRDAMAEGCDVLIYASHSTESGPPRVTWKGRYLGFVEAKNGAHPSGMTFRSASTDKYQADNQGHWFLFWEIADLVKLPAEAVLEIATLRGAGKKSNYKKSFIPEGPIVIQSPL